MTDIDKLEADRALDALVAEQVLGWNVCDTADDDKAGIAPGQMCSAVRVPNYSTDIAAAWEVAHELRRRGFDFQLQQSGAHHYCATGGDFTIFNEKTKVSFTCHNAVCGDGKIVVVDGIQRSAHEVAGGNGHGVVLLEAETEPLAICRAALKVVGATK